MEWLERMTRVIDYIEGHLDGRIEYDYFGRVFCCSSYEFSRMFSFMTGISLSEYVRRRRLSRAALDIQKSRARLTDVALQYGYESQAAFTRAFKEMHGHTPSQARKQGVTLKVCPKLSFQLSLRGAMELNYRLEEKESFQIIGLKGVDGSLRCEEGDKLTLLWREFMDHYNQRLWNGGNPSYYMAPFWQVGAYRYTPTVNGDTECIIGAELGDRPVLDGMDVMTVPAAKWLVFSINSPTGIDYVPKAYAEILEWFPESGYTRNTSAPHLEVFPGGTIDENYVWEIWMPVE
jgi:AraC family transcriptional regulator